MRALRIFGSTALCLAWVAAGRASAFQRGQSAPSLGSALSSWQLGSQVPSLGSAPARLLCLLRARLALWAARHSQEEAGPSLGAQPLPRALELAASEPADSHRH